MLHSPHTHTHTHTHWHAYLHCWDVLAGKGIGCVTDEKASLTNSPGEERKRVHHQRRACIYYITHSQYHVHILAHHTRIVSTHKWYVRHNALASHEHQQSQTSLSQGMSMSCPYMSFAGHRPKVKLIQHPQTEGNTHRPLRRHHNR